MVVFQCVDYILVVYRLYDTAFVVVASAVFTPKFLGTFQAVVKDHDFLLGLCSLIYFSSFWAVVAFYIQKYHIMRVKLEVSFSRSLYRVYFSIFISKGILSSIPVEMFYIITVIIIN